MDEKFIREEIRKKPKNKKRMAAELLRTAGRGIIFGLAFGLTSLWVMKTGLKEETDAGTEALLTEETETAEIPETEAAEETENSDAEDGSIAESAAFTPEEMQKMSVNLYERGKQYGSCMVQLDCCREGSDWFEKEYTLSDTGSGLIMENTSTDIWILSDLALVEGQEEVEVTFSNGRSADGQVAGQDKNTGIALIRVPREGYPKETFSDISQVGTEAAGHVRTGMLAIAVGNPLGDPGSVQVGLITATGRENALCDFNSHYFLTDMAAEEGTGGAIADLDGEVLGMILSQNQKDSGEQNLTAVRISDLLPAYQILKEKGRVPYLGLKLCTVTSAMSEEYGIPTGVYVESVETDSPAMEGGIQSGDVITQIGSGKVAAVATLYSGLLEKDVGDSCRILVSRKDADGYHDLSLKITVGCLTD